MYIYIYLSYVDDDTVVWKELEKENKEFFESYEKNREAKGYETEITKNCSDRDSSET